MQSVDWRVLHLFSTIVSSAEQQTITLAGNWYNEYDLFYVLIQIFLLCLIWDFILFFIFSLLTSVKKKHHHRRLITVTISLLSCADHVWILNAHAAFQRGVGGLISGAGSDRITACVCVCEASLLSLLAIGIYPTSNAAALLMQISG